MKQDDRELEGEYFITSLSSCSCSQPTSLTVTLTISSQVTVLDGSSEFLFTELLAE